MVKKEKAGKAYYVRQGLKVFALYLDPKMYATLQRFSQEDDRSLQKFLNRIISDYVRQRLLKEIKEPPPSA